jgi:hypothetical protein
MDNHQKGELITSLLGTLFFIAGILAIKKQTILMRNGIKARGTVIRVEKRLYDLKGLNFNYYPVIKYATLDKKWMIEEYDIAGSFKLYNEGDEVVVYYDKTKNDKFIIDNWWTRWNGPIFTVIGFGLLVFAVIVYFNPNIIPAKPL